MSQEVYDTKSYKLGKTEVASRAVTESLSTGLVIVNMGCVPQIRLVEQTDPKFTLICVRPEQREFS